MLARVLGDCTALPAPVGGVEALVELDARGVGSIHGWDVVTCAREEAMPDRPFEIAAVRTRVHARLDDELIARAQAYDPTRPLRLFLVWVNGD